MKNETEHANGGADETRRRHDQPNEPSQLDIQYDRVSGSTPAAAADLSFLEDWLELEAEVGAERAAVAVEVTRHEKESGPVSKQIALVDGKPKSDGSQCWISRGNSRRVRLPDWPEFAKLIEATPRNVAWSLGRMRADRADRCQLWKDSAAVQAAIAERADVVTRTKAMISYEPGRAAFVLLDFDTKGLSEVQMARLQDMGGFIGALGFLLPDLKSAGYIRRASTSANLFFVDDAFQFSRRSRSRSASTSISWPRTAATSDASSTRCLIAHGCTVWAGSWRRSTERCWSVRSSTAPSRAASG